MSKGSLTPKSPILSITSSEFPLYSSEELHVPRASLCTPLQAVDVYMNSHDPSSLCLKKDYVSYNEYDLSLK
ncbi:hypothetical protein RCL_jg12366.t1 [Rhizophagus clarus]|uniref:Uncharacterized protein n=1 Tax=Rhizophagus clarus TaxID=94130 RepID=A0A8H3KX51_9GLOM|nr:hypothetical protein RCL_jg12366.t1 [Rhizophagus clarus]